MHIAYAAHTDACTFYLDDDGICRRVLKKRAQGASASARAEDKAERCLGAQYVASLDPNAEGFLAALPRIGVPMLFAYVGENGRIALVRTGPVLRFEEHGTPDDRPSQRTTRPTLPGDAPSKPDSGVRARPEDEEDDPRTWVGGRRIDDDADEIETGVAIEPHVSDATAEMKTVPIDDADATDEDEDGASTQFFRSSRPPPFSMRAPVHPSTTPIPERPSWMPSTRVERVSIVPAAPASSPRSIESPPSTERDPAPLTPRGRGMLPARAGRGRG